MADNIERLRRRSSSSSSSDSASSHARSRPSAYLPRSSSLHGHGASVEALPSLQSIQSPRRRHNSGLREGIDTRDATAVSARPPIQPRTTSSFMLRTRPSSSQGSPISPNGQFPPRMRGPRPRTSGEPSHGYSNSFSSVYDGSLSGSPIVEEHNSGNTSPQSGSLTRSVNGDSQWAEWKQSSPGIPPSTPSMLGRSASTSAETSRPGLPPKNPLRHQHSASSQKAGLRSVSDPRGHPALPTGRQAFPLAGSSMPNPLTDSAPSTQIEDGHTTLSPDLPTHAHTVVSPWLDSPDASQVASTPGVGRSSSSNSRKKSSFKVPLPPMPSKNVNAGIGLGEDVGIPRSLSSTALDHDAQLTPWVSRERLRAEEDLTLSTELDGNTSAAAAGHDGSALLPPLVPSKSKKSKLSLSSAWKGGRLRSKTIEAADGAERKKEGASGSRIWTFGRVPDNENDSSSPFASMRKSKTVKGHKSEISRPQIRRVFNASEEAFDVQDTEEARPNGDKRASGHASLSSIRSRSTSDTHVGNPAASASVVSLGSPSISTHDINSATFSPRSTGMPSGVERSLGFRSNGWVISQDNLSSEMKRLVKRWYVLRELLETERSYASDLAVARDVYLARARMKAGIISPILPFNSSASGFFNQLASPAAPKPQPQQLRAPPSMGKPPIIMRPSPVSPPRQLMRHASTDSNSHALGSSALALHATSPGSLTSSNPSNRSSMYTVSSQSSQTSDGASHPLPPMPAGIAGLAARPAAAFGNGLGSPSSYVSSSASTSTTGLKNIVNTSVTSLNSSIPSASSTPVFSMTPTGFLGSQMMRTTSAGAGTPDAPLTAVDVRIIFAQLEQCAALADEMTAILEDAVGSSCLVTSDAINNLIAESAAKEQDETDRVGRAFLKLMPRIDQVYAAYCSRHEMSMSRLQELLSTQPKVVAFLKECTEAARKHTNAWDLASLLIKPVQRVLKYPLLLQQILASTTEMHPDYDDLQTAFTQIQKVADHINEVKKRKDLIDQIVSGKAARRTTSQKVQHGTVKKLKRRQEKVKNAVVGPSTDVIAEDDEAYRSYVGQLHSLEGGVESFARQCIEWSDALREAYMAQIALLEQWRVTFLLDKEPEVDGPDERLRALAMTLRDQVVDIFWNQLDGEIRTSIIPMTHRIGQMFANPNSVIAKRQDRELDYSRYRADLAKSISKAPDRKLAESASAFAALHAQLMDELPQFIYGVQTLLDICVESLARQQAAHHFHVQKAMIEFWQTHSWADKDEFSVNEATNEPSMRHLNPVKIFWDVHSNMAELFESLAITSRRSSSIDLSSANTSRRPSEAFSSSTLSRRPSEVSSYANDLRRPSEGIPAFTPLQLRQDLPNPEFTPPVPSHFASYSPVPRQTSGRRAGANATKSMQSYRTATTSTQHTPISSPALRANSPNLGGSEALLGSPAQINSSSGRLGGVAGLVKSISGSFSVPGSSSNNTKSPRVVGSKALPDEHLSEAEDSEAPPTPISKDTPVKRQTGPADKRTSVPVLPALTFNDAGSFFVQNGPTGLPFLDEDDESSPVITGHREAYEGTPVTEKDLPLPGGLGITAEEPEVENKERTNSFLRQRFEVLATMAAVADSPPRGPKSEKMGYPMIEYCTGDLFRVMVAESDEKGMLFGRTEHGELGWGERASFVPLV